MGTSPESHEDNLKTWLTTANKADEYSRAGFVCQIGTPILALLGIWGLLARPDDWLLGVMWLGMGAGYWLLGNWLFKISEKHRLKLSGECSAAIVAYMHRKRQSL
jgi:hypothetical protein